MPSCARQYVCVCFARAPARMRSEPGVRSRQRGPDTRCAARGWWDEFGAYPGSNVRELPSRRPRETELYAHPRSAQMHRPAEPQPMLLQAAFPRGTRAYTHRRAHTGACACGYVTMCMHRALNEGGAPPQYVDSRAGASRAYSDWRCRAGSLPGCLFRSQRRWRLPLQSAPRPPAKGWRWARGCAGKREREHISASHAHAAHCNLHQKVNAWVSRSRLRTAGRRSKLSAPEAVCRAKEPSRARTRVRHGRPRGAVRRRGGGR
jgi:hypothetical protein